MSKIIKDSYGIVILNKLRISPSLRETILTPEIRKSSRIAIGFTLKMNKWKIALLGVI